MTKKTSSIDYEVGRRIRLQRIDAGLSQAELGGKVGVTSQHVHALRLLKAYLAISDKRIQASILEMVESIASNR
jgi:transcriptional regulator with XRE-family HTH domain